MFIPQLVLLHADLRYHEVPVQRPEQQLGPGGDSVCQCPPRFRPSAWHSKILPEGSVASGRLSAPAFLPSRFLASHPNSLERPTGPYKKFCGRKEGGGYEGVSEAVDYLKKVISEEGPFEGVLGFSQGANLVSMTAALAEKNATSLGLKVCETCFFTFVL